MIAGRSGGTREAMNAPETGILVGCDAPEELGVAIDGLLQDADRRERMGRAGREWVVERFGWERLAARAAEMFETDR